MFGDDNIRIGSTGLEIGHDVHNKSIIYHDKIPGTTSLDTSSPILSTIITSRYNCRRMVKCITCLRYKGRDSMRIETINPSNHSH